MSEMERRPDEMGRPAEPVKIQRDEAAGYTSPRPAPPAPEIFMPPPVRPGGMSLSTWLLAGAVVLAVVAGLLLAGHRKTPALKGIQPPDPYASSLPLSGLQMSESSSFSGVKSTYIEGRISNRGD